MQFRQDNACSRMPICSEKSNILENSGKRRFAENHENAVIKNFREKRKKMSKFKAFLKRKDIEFSAKRYFGDAFSSMAVGLFASLIVGQILKTLGEQTAILLGENIVSAFLVDAGALAMSMMGAAIGVAVSYGLKAPNLVLFCGVITGAMGSQFGGPAGAFVAAAFGCELGKMIYKETKLDIILTPAVTVLIGMLAAKTIGPLVDALMTGLGKIIMDATELQPFFMGIVIAVIIGLVLTAPISSAALCIMLDLSGLAAGAATVGCCCQMVGFATISFRDNGVGGLLAQGIGTSMLQISNIVKNWWILLPPTLASVVMGPIATCIFHMENIPTGAGMGSAGFVGQIGTFTAMGFTGSVAMEVLILQFIMPAALAFAFAVPLRHWGKIKDGDLKLDL